MAKEKRYYRGISVENILNTAKDDELNERIELEDALWDAYEYLYTCKDYTDKIIDLEQENKECEQNFVEIKNTKEPTLLLTVVTFYICGVLFILATIISNFIMTIIGVAGIAVTIFISRKKFKQKKALPEKKAMEYWNSIGSPACVANNSKIKEIELQLRSYAEENKECVQFLPASIRYDYEAVAFVSSAIWGEKADTIKEAMQLYDNHLHQLKMQATMQNMANSMYAHNQAMEAYMSDVVEQQKITNSKLSDIENWTFLDYMNNKYGD